MPFVSTLSLLSTNSISSSSILLLFWNMSCVMKNWKLKYIYTLWLKHQPTYTMWRERTQLYNFRQSQFFLHRNVKDCIISSPNTFKRLNIAAELLQVPSIRMKCIISLWVACQSTFNIKFLTVMTYSVTSNININMSQLRRHRLNSKEKKWVTSGKHYLGSSLSSVLIST